ncbi:MAG: iron-containing alcohol dehydrogenase [Planctomycetes bacterium]|nr:iron-containing alcohol dehydrogenase [Planctomycetota bacterium]
MTAFRCPVEVHFGRGCVARRLPALLVRPALIVTGRATLARAGLDGLLGDGVFASVPVAPNPSPAAVEALAAQARELGARTLVGLGGGSVLDAAKAAAVLCGHDATLAHLAAREAGGERVRRRVTLVAVPTTAGTGSEVTRWASLWTDGTKASFDHPDGFADVALVDPALTDTAPAALTATTGLDALAHAMEALWGLGASPLSDVHAEAALALVGEHLLPAVRGAHASARDGMALAALHAGLALSCTQSAAAHALSYALTGRHGVAHGHAVGLLCRALLPVNARAVPERVERIVAALGRPSIAAAQDFVDEVLDAAGLPSTLGALGVPRDAHAALAAAASGAERLANNPGRLSPSELLSLLESIA